MNSDLAYIAFLLIIWVLVHALLKRKGKTNLWGRLEVGPYYLMLRSSFLNNFLRGGVEKHRKYVDLFFSLGTLASIFAMLYGFYFLSEGVYKFIAYRGTQPGTVALIIPGVTVKGTLLMKMLPAIVLVLISHELFHKLAMHTYKIDVKSVGLALILFIPAAFVEPDEESFKKSRSMARVKVLAAGSLANIILAALFYAPVAYPNLYEAGISLGYGPPSGVIISGVIPKSPLANATDIKGGDIIVGINGKPIHTIQDLVEVRLKPDEEVTITYLKRENILKGGEAQPEVVTLVTMEDPYNKERGIIGIIYPAPLKDIWPMATYYPPKYPWLSLDTPAILFEIVLWCFAISLGVAAINMLPIYPLDGYGLTEALLEKVGVKGRGRKITLYTLMTISLILLALNIIASYLPQLIFKP